MKAAIIIDNWKYKIFKKMLKKKGYTWEKSPGVTPDTMTLTVKCKDLNKFAPFVKKMNEKAAKSI